MHAQWRAINDKNVKWGIGREKQRGIINANLSLRGTLKSARKRYVPTGLMKYDKNSHTGGASHHYSHVEIRYFYAIHAAWWASTVNMNITPESKNSRLQAANDSHRLRFTTIRFVLHQLFVHVIFKFPVKFILTGVLLKRSRFKDKSLGTFCGLIDWRH